MRNETMYKTGFKYVNDVFIKRQQINKDCSSYIWFKAWIKRLHFKNKRWCEITLFTIIYTLNGTISNCLSET